MSKIDTQKGQMVNTLFTLLLFLVFVLCALFTVLIGGRVYENINARTEAAYQNDVALSYIANKVRQGDEEGAVALKEMEGVKVLVLEQRLNDTVYVTDIYYQDGKLWELFTDAGSGLGVGDGYEIMACNEITMELEDGLLHLQSEGKSSVWLSLRSGGGENE